MSQQKPERPQKEQQPHIEPIKYGDVFQVTGELANKAIAPQDAAMMQSAESGALGQTRKGGAAAVMESAADFNEKLGHVGHRDVTDIPGDQGVNVTATDYPGARIVTQSVAGQVVGQYYQPTPVQQTDGGRAPVQAQLTIGEALEATAQTAGDKPVDKSDAAAIQAAEVRATGSNLITPGGVAATAQSAAAYNASLDRDEDKVKLGDILSAATAILPADKPATREDAEGVISAELRNTSDLEVKSVGVAASVAAAARLNQSAP